MRKCFSEIYRGYIRSVKNVTNQSVRTFERPVSLSTILDVFPLVTEEYSLSIVLSIFWATSTLHITKSYGPAIATFCHSKRHLIWTKKRNRFMGNSCIFGSRKRMYTLNEIYLYNQAYVIKPIRLTDYSLKNIFSIGWLYYEVMLDSDNNTNTLSILLLVEIN